MQGNYTGGKQPHLSVFIRPVTDEGASRRIFTLVVVVSIQHSQIISSYFSLNIFGYLTIHNGIFLALLCLIEPELFAADPALVAINTLFVALSWLRYNLRISFDQAWKIVGLTHMKRRLGILVI